MYRPVLNKLLLLPLITTLVTGCTQSKETTYQGYWVYGFETSIFETCDGNMFWMWSPADFEGTYQTDGFRNPVNVVGTELPADPDENMMSTLPELSISRIEHTSDPCRE